MTEARIVYLPHCSKCGKLLHGNISVTLERDYSVVRKNDVVEFNMPSYEFSPMACPNCGALFNQIAYPAGKDDRKEPFKSNTEQYMECKIT